MERRVVEIPAQDDLHREVWETPLALQRREPKGWTLIGAQMVALHAYERHRAPPRLSLDADVLVNVRVVAGGAQPMSQTLQEMGFSLGGPDPENVAHRFRRDDVQIDVLAPDGLRAESKQKQLLTVPPARTVSVPGGTVALDRSETVTVRVGQLTGTIPRPDLLGAILVKVRAIQVDDAPDNQRRDVAFLCALVDDPRTLGEALRGNQRSWLRRQTELLRADAEAWQLLGEAGEDAHQAYRVLAGA
jgi:hypothetical protein